MLDTMTLTKATAAFCGALLVLLLGGWISSEIFITGENYVEGHAGDEDHAPGFIIEANDGAVEVVEEEYDFNALLAEADAAKGERLFRACAACHKVGPGENGTGPTLYNIVDRQIAGEPGFAFSSALTSLEGVWDFDALDHFIANPRSYAPGTAMGYAGMRKLEDRADLVAYLNSLGG